MVGDGITGIKSDKSESLKKKSQLLTGSHASMTLSGVDDALILHIGIL